MTPMVDIAFLLLIFFMTTTTFKPPEEVTIDLPRSSAEYKVPESNVLILTITRTGDLFVQNDPRSSVQKIDMSQLGGWVRSERSRNPRVRMIVKADKNCEYGVMQDVMDVLQVERTNRFVLMTEGEGAEQGEKTLPEALEGEPLEGYGVGAGHQLAQAGSDAVRPEAAASGGEPWVR